VSSIKTQAAPRDAAPWRSPRKRRTPTGLILPAIVFLFLVTQLPFLLTIYYSLRSWNLLRPDLGQEWVGLENYESLFSDGTLLAAMWNTLIFTGAVVVLSLLLGLGFALLVNRPFPGRGIVRTLLITPMLIMPVVGALVWKNMMLHPVYGAVPWALSKVGIQKVDVLAQQPMAGVIGISVWQWTPFMMLVLLAGLSSVDETTLEAARIDGASKWHEFWYVVLPHLSSYATVAVLLGTLFVLPTFDTLYVATGGGPGFATTNLAYAVYKIAFANYDVGLSSALGLINAVFSLAVCFILIRVIGRIFARGEVLQ
jgi:sorbitol/mannitol transport system permease protein